MPSALKQQQNVKKAQLAAQLEITEESANEGPALGESEEDTPQALAAQIQKARQAARLSVLQRDQPLIKVEATVDVEAANQPQSIAAPVADAAAQDMGTPETAGTATSAQSTPAAALPPQTMIPGGMAGGQIPQGAQGTGQEGDEEGAKEGEEGKEDGEGDEADDTGEGAEEGEGEDDEDSEDADEEGGDEAAQQSELERDKANARENQGGEGDEEGGEGEKSAGDEEAENEGLAGAVPNPEEAMVYGSQASLTASFYELPTLLKGNIGPLLYIHMHFLGYYLLPDIPFLALIPILKTKPKFEKPNVFHNIGFMVILFVELLGTVVMIMQLMIPILIIYAIVALAKLDWEQVRGIFSFFSGFELGKTLFGIIKGFF